MEKLPYFIGVDHHEMDSFLVAAHTAKKHASRPIDVVPLEHLGLRRQQLFYRTWRIDANGTYFDELDGKPFSSQFAHTRFLTPIVAKRLGYKDWALFTDCDWMWLDDPWKLLRYANPHKTVMVVKHNYQPEVSIKKDGQPQHPYNRKLWSAMVLWNLRSEYLPTVEMVNVADGGFLHAFRWMPDDQIGELPEEWHWCPHVSPTTTRAIKEPVKAVHFTLGVPGMTDRKQPQYDLLWKQNLKEALHNRADHEI